MKIKEGEYIRTKQGYIAKVEDITENIKDIIMCDSDIYSDYEVAPVLVDEQIKLITKHSFNIIDLIEVGDIIQYKELKKLNCGTNVGQKYVGNIADKEELEEVKKEIQTKGIELVGIVTKEQFNSVMYKVGG